VVTTDLVARPSRLDLLEGEVADDSADQDLLPALRQLRLLEGRHRAALAGISDVDRLPALADPEALELVLLGIADEDPGAAVPGVGPAVSTVEGKIGRGVADQHVPHVAVAGSVLDRKDAPLAVAAGA
jgi:hypothetical protein